jgi:hypothetical protein
MDVYKEASFATANQMRCLGYLAHLIFFVVVKGVAIANILNAYLKGIPHIWKMPLPLFHICLPSSRALKRYSQHPSPKPHRIILIYAPQIDDKLHKLDGSLGRAEIHLGLLRSHYCWLPYWLVYEAGGYR